MLKTYTQVRTAVTTIWQHGTALQYPCVSPSSVFKNRYCSAVSPPMSIDSYFPQQIVEDTTYLLTFPTDRLSRQWTIVVPTVRGVDSLTFKCRNPMISAKRLARQNQKPLPGEGLAAWLWNTCEQYQAASDINGVKVSLLKYVRIHLELLRIIKT